MPALMLRRRKRPVGLTLGKSGANTAAIEGIRADPGAEIEMRQSKTLNSLIEQDHRAVKRIARPMLGLKNLRCARSTARRDRDHAHAQKGPARRDQRSSFARSQSALLAGLLNF